MLFVNLSILLSTDQLKNWDAWIYQIVVSNMSPNMTIFIKHVTQLASVNILISIAVIIYLLLTLNKKAVIYGKFIVFNLFTVWQMNDILKMIFQRERPHMRIIEISGYSFPSGHAMIGMCFYGFLAYLILRNSNSQWIKTISVSCITCIAIMIGISRVYLGVHYASDVIAGFAFGWVWMFLIIISMEKYFDWCIKKLSKKVIKIK